MDVMSNGTALTGISPAEMEVLNEGQASGVSSAPSTQPPVPSTQSPAQPTEQPAFGEDSGQQGSADQPTAEPEGDGGSNICTVTFVYHGVVFGTQTVEEGQRITVPKLAPALSGAWDFDFSQPVTRDITIEWK